MRRLLYPRLLYPMLLAMKLMAQSPCVLRGHVVDGPSARPIERAQVFVQTSRGEATYRAVTDASGIFCFRSLAPGSYRILVKRYGYLDVQAVDSGRGKSETLVIPPATLPAELTISMSPFSVISGVVLLQSGDPLADARVTLYGHFPPGQPVTMDDPRETVTDAAGRFRFAGLKGGKYHLGVSGREDMAVHDMAPGAAGKQTVDTFYPASPTTGGAQAIAVAPGRDVDGLVITVRTTPLRTLAGRVVSREAPKYITADFSEPTGGSTGYVLQVMPDGTFSRGGLPAGICNIHIAPKFDRRIDLTRGDVTDLVIKLDQP